MRGKVGTEKCDTSGRTAISLLDPRSGVTTMIVFFSHLKTSFMSLSTDEDQNKGPEPSAVSLSDWRA